MKSIHSDLAPKAVGPYAQAICHDGLLYCSGQIGLDPQTACLVEGGLAAQSKRLMQNLDAVLQQAGSCREQILKVTIYLVDMDDFAEVNSLYAAWLGTHRPARATLAVASLPLGARLEMDAVAWVKKDGE